MKPKPKITHVQLLDQVPVTILVLMNYLQCHIIYSRCSCDPIHDIIDYCRVNVFSVIEYRGEGSTDAPGAGAPL